MCKPKTTEGSSPVGLFIVLQRRKQSSLLKSWPFLRSLEGRVLRPIFPRAHLDALRCTFSKVLVFLQGTFSNRSSLYVWLADCWLTFDVVFRRP